MRHTGSSQRSSPSGLHTADCASWFTRAWKDERGIPVLFFFPFAQDTKRQVREWKRFGRARCFHVRPKADEAMLPIHLVPTQTESFAIGPPSRLHEQDNANAKMGRCLTQDAVLLVQREHLLVRTVAQFVEMFHCASGIFRDVLPANSEIERACKAFEFAIDGGTLDGAAFIANRGVLPAMVAILFDQPCSDICQHKSHEECPQVFEIGSVAFDRVLGNPCEV